VAYLLSVGDGPEAPRIYRTTDGGATWIEQHRNGDPAGFFDCFAFWTPRRAILMADSVQREGHAERQFPVLRTEDGEHWIDIAASLPMARPFESAFAASGTCAATHGGNHAWLVTGATVFEDAHSAPARVLATTDAGDTWAAYEAPFPGTDLAGLFSIAFRNTHDGIVGAGDLARGDDTTSPNVARSSDGGRTWMHAKNRTPFAGAVFGIAYANGNAGAGTTGGAHSKTVVATGPAGAAYSFDEGDTWTLLPSGARSFALGAGSVRRIYARRTLSPSAPAMEATSGSPSAPARSRPHPHLDRVRRHRPLGSRTSACAAAIVELPF
jgi:photosystem II stability/assembly factor-like uncharacterized protein